MPRWSTTGAATVLRDLIVPIIRDVLIPLAGAYAMLTDRPLTQWSAGAYLVMMGLPVASWADRKRERRHGNELADPPATPLPPEPPVRPS